MMTADGFTISEDLLEVGDGHRVYVQDWGVAGRARPVLSLHGGPGTACSDSHKEYFNGTRQRVIFHDQRGVGNSQPYGSLERNTTPDLIDDMVRILDHCRVEQAVIMGGSWGSCLALAFAVAHPERVHSLVLYGVMTPRQREMDWLNEGRWRTFFPEVWQWYLDRTPVEHHDDPTGYHFGQLLGDDEKAQRESAYVYTTVDSAVLELDDRFRPAPFEDDFDPAPARAQAYYFTNSHFLPDGYVLDNAQRLTMPVYLVQGRYDMICPAETAYRLAEVLPHGELIWTTSGHAPDRESWNLMRLLMLGLTQ
jgi:proline iminopeptidase